MRSSIVRLAGMAALAMAVAACEDDPTAFTPAERDFRPTVVLAADEVELSSALTGRDMAELNRLVGTQSQASQTKFTVISTAGPGPARIVRDRLVSAGITSERLSVLVDHPLQGQRPGVLVIRNDFFVDLPNCGTNQSSDLLGGLAHGSTDLGCATSRSLGLMVADPEDLIVGRTLGPADGTQSVLGIERYRTGQVQDVTTGIGDFGEE